MAEEVRLHLQLVNDVFGLLTELSLIPRLARIDYRSFGIAKTCGNRGGFIVGLQLYVRLNPWLEPLQQLHEIV